MYEIKINGLNDTGASQKGQRLILFGTHVVQELWSVPASTVSWSVTSAGTVCKFHPILSPPAAVAASQTMQVYVRVAADSASIRAWQWLDATGLPTLPVKMVADTASTY
jgi:hypothetical protein